MNLNIILLMASSSVLEPKPLHYSKRIRQKGGDPNRKDICMRKNYSITDFKKQQCFITSIPPETTQ